MLQLSTQLSAFSLNMVHQSSGDAFTPVVDGVCTATPTGPILQGRQDSTCIQTVEHPIWYGADFNTCCMQTTTAPCSVYFPSTSCHTVGPAPFPAANAVSESTKMWIVIGMTVFLIMIIPVLVLWIRWKFISTRRGGKRSISIQLEKMEDKKPSKETSGSSSTPETDSTPTSSKTPTTDSGPGAFHRLWDRNFGIPVGGLGNIEVVNNTKMNMARPGHPPNQGRYFDVPPPMSPRIAPEPLPLNHSLRLPQSQPWMHQGPDGRWVPKEEGWLHPGLPPSPRLRDERNNFQEAYQGGNAERGRYDVPDAWRY